MTVALLGIFFALPHVSCGDSNADKTVLAENKQTRYTIIQAEQCSEAEKFAAKELAEFLGRVTGAAFPIITESGFSGERPGIYVGWTKYAVQNGIDVSRLGEEEWLIRSIGDNLVLTGGRPRGTMYAVYEFLEKQVGCHWLDKDTEIVPSRPYLSISKLDVKGKPFFWQREVIGIAGCTNEQWQFLLRNKNCRYDLLGRDTLTYPPAGMFYQLSGYPRKSHSFSYFVNAKDWFASHPEYFSMDANGKRIPAYDEGGPGQLCLTNPDVRRLTKAKLREFIAKDRAEAARKGCPPPKVYAINHNDKYDAHCKCATCQVIAKKEGGESGPLIDFINEVAEDIEKDYPDVLVSTLAYNLTSTPPRTIRPRKNVIIGWCDVYVVSDMLRPLSDPLNSRNYKELASWSKVAPRLAISDDYWSPFGYYSHFPAPYSMIQCLGPDIRYFADCHAESFFAESNDHLEAGEHFTPLKFWLAYQLLVNPYQPAESLIKIFMDGYYGNAASAMHDYMDYLHKRILEESVPQVLREAPHMLKYLDLNFFIKAEKFFDAAESQVKVGTPESRHVRKERLILDGALLFLWPWLERRLKPDEKMSFDHETVLKRYDEYWRTHQYYSLFYSKESKAYSQEGKLREKVVGLLRDPKLPEPFNKLPIRETADFNWLTFAQYSPAVNFIDDADAAGGIAAEPAAMSAIQAAEKSGDKPAGGSFFDKPLSFGATGGSTVTLKPGDIPQDGKYHLHKIGWVDVKPGTVVWALEGKRLSVNVDRLFIPGAETPDANAWIAYVSLKLKGPAYVRNSTDPNGVWMDRVLLVKPQKGEEIDAVELARRAEVKRRLELRPSIAVPRLPEKAGGDPLKVNWGSSARLGVFYTISGTPETQRISVKLANDGEYLYVQLEEKLDPKITLRSVADVFSGDDWELLIAAKREIPYRQIAISPEGKSVELAYGEPGWESGVKMISDIGVETWTVSLAFPLERLVPGGIGSGQSVYVNVLRGGKKAFIWSPLWGDKFHTLEHFGEWKLK